MFITNKHMSRRTLLRGMGASVRPAVPGSDVARRRAWAKTAAGRTNSTGRDRDGPRRRGKHQVRAREELWSPAAEGSAFDLTPTSLALEPYRDYLHHQQQPT
jgi:hypothetical protein